MKKNDLKETLSRCTYKVRFDILQGDVYITSGENFELYIITDQDFTMAKETYEMIWLPMKCKN